jgi:hypothetical protein
MTPSQLAMVRDIAATVTQGNARLRGVREQVDAEQRALPERLRSSLSEDDLSSLGVSLTNAVRSLESALEYIAEGTGDEDEDED